jgi:hypothetical protein
MSLVAGKKSLAATRWSRFSAGAGWELFDWHVMKKLDREVALKFLPDLIIHDRALFGETKSRHVS